MKRPVKKFRDYEIDWYTERELLDMFSPEIEDVILEKSSDLQGIISEKKLLIAEHLKNINCSEADKFSKWFAREIVKMEFAPELVKYNQELSRFKRYEQLLKPPPDRKTPDFQEKLGEAKRRQIQDVVGQYVELRRAGKNFIGLCPFHSEKRASFYIYTESNTYHCFGCQKHGDVINFIQEIQGVDFREAVNILQN